MYVLIVHRKDDPMTPVELAQECFAQGGIVTSTYVDRVFSLPGVAFEADRTRHT